MEATYEIPVIPHNLRREETIVQIADALSHLSNVSNDIIDRINKRIETNAANLVAITKRIQAAQDKVIQLRGAKDATQVFSSSKYPAVNTYKPYESIFTKEHGVVLTRTKHTYRNIQNKEDGLETLQFYHVKVEEKTDDTLKGLGEIPSDLENITDLLLYNTGKNPYVDYAILENLKPNDKSHQNEVNQSKIAAPPSSITKRAGDASKSTYLYSPDLGEVPTIDLPLDLPDLPGIAQLRYTDKSERGIAPSVTSTPIVPDLPQLPVEETPDLLPDLPELPAEPELAPLQIEEPQVKVEPDVSLPIIADAHASLMEAIRNAAGATTGTKKPVKSRPVTGDLMADLHAKLSMRRKGISGAKTSEESPNSTMDKISAMIPPPPNKAEQSDSTNTEDEEWD